jgi:Coenzyme PQQ synthesis protein D (PqqD)
MGANTKGDAPVGGKAAGAARIPAHVVFRSFPNETVALNLETGRYHGLNPVAGRMLEALEKTASLAAAAELLAGEYEQPAATVEADLRRLCADLAARGLIELSADGVA